MVAGGLTPCESNVKRRASDMRGYFHAEINGSDPLVYETYERDVPHVPGELVENITVIYPGTVDGEYFMTKGHYHENSHSAEVYLCLSGEGRLLMESEDGDWEMLTMTPGTTVHVPPAWAHRSANVGSTPLIIYALYPADAGHNYARIAEFGFTRRLLQGEDNNPRLVLRERR